MYSETATDKTELFDLLAFLDWFTFKYLRYRYNDSVDNDLRFYIHILGNFFSVIIMQELTFMLPYAQYPKFPTYFIFHYENIIQNARVVSNILSLIFYGKPGVCFIIIIS